LNGRYSGNSALHRGQRALRRSQSSTHCRWRRPAAAPDGWVSGLNQHSPPPNLGGKELWWRRRSGWGEGWLGTTHKFRDQGMGMNPKRNGGNKDPTPHHNFYLGGINTIPPDDAKRSRAPVVDDGEGGSLSAGISADGSPRGPGTEGRHHRTESSDSSYEIRKPPVCFFKLTFDDGFVFRGVKERHFGGRCLMCRKKKYLPSLIKKNCDTGEMPGDRWYENRKVVGSGGGGNTGPRSYGRHKNNMRNEGVGLKKEHGHTLGRKTL